MSGGVELLFRASHSQWNCSSRRKDNATTVYYALILFVISNYNQTAVESIEWTCTVMPTINVNRENFK